MAEQWGGKMKRLSVCYILDVSTLWIGGGKLSSGEMEKGASSSLPKARWPELGEEGKTEGDSSVVREVPVFAHHNTVATDEADGKDETRVEPFVRP